ncbi:MAG: tetratricopeptide repeat protein, partial [Thaumarchaeota archaeon]|nr:tetratricopeptide repeat protein [Nitrososphaerota archaeon]
MKEARAAFANIITNYPRSKLVCDANVELGNYFFDTNQLAPARHAFEEGLKCPKTGTYAKYKLAWCDYNAGDYKLAISRFKEVISTSDKASKEGNNLRLKTEALRDLVLSFQKAGELETAIDYYKREVGVSSARKYIVNLAGKYFDAGGYDYSSRTYRNYLIKAYSTDSSAPEWQTKIVLAYDKMGNRPQVRKEIEALVSGYGPTSSWARAQKDKSALERAINLTEEALYNLVTDYHQEAIKTKSVATYKLARDIYKEYLDHFPRSERAYAMRFYYAEILYALEDYQAALTQYNLVIDDKGKLQDYRKISAKDQLLAAEKLVDIDDGTYKKEIQDDTQKIDEGKSKGGITATNIKAKVDKNKSESDLTAHEKQLVASCDRYLSIIPKADDEASVRLRGAVIYFFKAQYVEASTRFAYIIKNWPQDPSSADAAGLILEALEAKQEWAELNTRASEFAENTKLLEGTADKKKDLRKKLPVYIEGSAFKLAQIVNDKDKDYPKAAGLFRDFAKKYPQSKFTPIALYNSFIIYQNAKQLDQAVQVGELLLKNYPKADSDEWRTLPGEDAKKRDPILADLTFRLAKTYELTADFIGAEKYYEQYMKNFPSEKSVLDAQWNAALWYRGLGQYDKAIAAREKYIKMCASATRGKAVTRGKSKEKDTKAAATECYAEPDVFWEIAGLYEDQKLWVKDIKQINDYLMKYSKVIEPWKVLRAKYHQLLAFKAQGISKQ